MPLQTQDWRDRTLKDSLQTDVARGLTQAEAARRLAQYGPNTLAQARERSAFSILIAQFRSLIVALLVAATLIAFSMGENIEGFAILVVIVLNAAIGFFTEWKAEQALSALQNQSVRVAHVIRDGTESEIPAAALVPGDLIVLAAGARVPADGRIVESARLQIEEAALTGESHAAKLMMCDRRFAKSVWFGNPRRINRRATRPATVGRIKMMRQRVMPV